MPDTALFASIAEQMASSNAVDVDYLGPTACNWGICGHDCRPESVIANRNRITIA